MPNGQEHHLARRQQARTQLFIYHHYHALVLREKRCWQFHFASYTQLRPHFQQPRLVVLLYLSMPLFQADAIMRRYLMPRFCRQR